MKQKLKKTTKLLTLFFLIALSSCQEDFDDEYQNSQYQKVSFKDYSLKEANKIPKFKNVNGKVVRELSKAKKKNKSSTKDSQSDIVIDSSTVKEISFDNFTSYTMLIEKEDPTQDYFENLVIHLQNDTLTDVFTIKYTPTQPPVYNETTKSYNFVGEFEPTRNVSTFHGPSGEEGEGSGGDNGGITGGGGGGSSVTSCGWFMMCDRNINGGLGVEHTAGSLCTNQYLKQICSSISTTGYTGFYGGSGPHVPGGGGTPTGNTTTTSSSPVTSVIQPPDEKKCELFNKLKNDAQFKGIIEFLKTKTTEPTETGYALTKTPTGYIALPGVPDPTKKYAIAFTIPNGTTVDILTHVHNTGGLSIFSLEDIEQMYKVFRDNYDSLDSGQTFISVVVTPNGEVYALTITDRAAFVQTYLAFLNTEEKLYKTRITFDNDPSLFNSSYFGINSGHTREDNEKNFLRFIGNTAGIKLHKANADLSQWNPLKLNALSGVEKEPACN